MDFLRRLEDPALVGRAILIDGVNIALSEEYPTLTVGMTARVFTTGEIGIIADDPDDEATPAPTTTETPSPGATETVTSTETEVVTSTETPAALAPTEVAP